MSRIIPLGSPRYRGNSDVVLPRQFTGELIAGVAVSLAEANASQPVVKLFDGSKFAGFSVHDIEQNVKTLSVIKTGEAVCLRLKDGEVLVIGDSFAIDNTTGFVVASGSENSTNIMGDVAELDVTGVDHLGRDVQNCILVNLYGGVAPASSGGGSTGISDAPADGTPYVRQDGAWVAETTGVEDAPSDDAKYVRQNADWVVETKGVEEAPSDGTPYVRQDAGWVSETLPDPAVQSATVKPTKK